MRAILNVGWQDCNVIRFHERGSVAKRLKTGLEIEALKWVEIDPQIAGGIGATLFAKAIVEKSHKA